MDSIEQGQTSGHLAKVRDWTDRFLSYASDPRLANWSWLEAGEMPASLSEEFVELDETGWSLAGELKDMIHSEQSLAPDLRQKLVEASDCLKEPADRHQLFLGASQEAIAMLREHRDHVEPEASSCIFCSRPDLAPRKTDGASAQRAAFSKVGVQADDSPLVLMAERAAQAESEALEDSLAIRRAVKVLTQHRPMPVQLHSVDGQIVRPTTRDALEVIAELYKLLDLASTLDTDPTDDE